MTDAVRTDEIKALLDACIPASAEYGMPKFSDVTDVAALVAAFAVECGDGDFYEKLVNALVRIKDGEKPRSIDGGVIVERLMLEAYFTAPVVVEKLKEEPDRMLAEHEAKYNDYADLLAGVDFERKIYKRV